MKKLIVFDSTLRDGAQAQGISFSVEDKVKIVEKLDMLGVDYIEAGNPFSNPKDIEFFERLKKHKFRHAKIIAFGSTCRVNAVASEDQNVKSLLDTGAEAICIFGKSWDFHVTDVLRTTLEENLRMIGDTVRYIKEMGREVVYDAELFFEGYRANPEYAIQTLCAAADAGADTLCLCDTTGGSFPDEIHDVTAEVVELFDRHIGIHCHNDTGMAVANTIMAVRAGAVHIQGTMNGYGERCGNANLCTIIPNLQIKLGYECIPQENLPLLTSVSRYVSEVANIVHDERAPYVGTCAFTHKAGMHADAVTKNSSAYEHVAPETVGGERVFLMSEVAGRSAVLNVVNDIDPTIKKDSPEIRQIIGRLKEMEHQGYQYEAAESSFEIVVRKLLGIYKPFFVLKEFKVIVNEPCLDGDNASAIIKIEVDGETEMTAAQGDGPVNALDNALRKALFKFYPQINGVKLTDYKVRVLDSEAATAAKVRVLIQSTDGSDVWTTIGVSTDIIDASWKALVDSIEYKLIKDQTDNK